MHVHYCHIRNSLEFQWILRCYLLSRKNSRLYGKFHEKIIRELEIWGTEEIIVINLDSNNMHRRSVWQLHMTVILDFVAQHKAFRAVKSWTLFFFFFAVDSI